MAKRDRARGGGPRLDDDKRDGGTGRGGMRSRVASPAPRRGATEVVVFGRHPVEAALASPDVELERVSILRSRPEAERAALRARCAERGVPLDELSRPALDGLTGAPRHDQGIAARLRLLRVMPVDALVAASKGRSARAPMRVLALDGVTNSQNVGMVVRSLVAAGFDGLLWPEVGQPWINGLVVRAAAGAIYACPIATCGRLEDGLATLQGAGFVAIGLDAGAGGSLFDLGPPHRAVFVLGSESGGLSPGVSALLDRRVAIPMHPAVESLNVAVAAGLVCYHARHLPPPAGAG